MVSFKASTWPPKSNPKRVDHDIAERTIDLLLTKGYSIEFDEEIGPERHTSKETILPILFDLDEAQIFLHDRAGKIAGWVFFVFGNDGPDVIADHSGNLTDLLSTESLT